MRLKVKRTLASLGHAYEPHDHWIRQVMVADTQNEFRKLNPPNLDIAEISGDLWRSWPWRSRTEILYPDVDLCDPPADLPGPFDLVICEQVLEHVKNPLRAVATLRDLCKPEGYVYVSTPFLVRLHDSPGDYWRYTPEGMRLLLESQGLSPLWVRSWGNRKAIVGNFDRWRGRRPWDTLRNEPNLPAVVWSLARPSTG
jgi:SAM-dependent methyltransferase